MRDVDRLRRSTTDRYVAGVAGGLGRHFDIDPTVIRVAFVVLTLFGGAGALVYGAVWLFVPDDGQQRAPVDVSTDVRKVILIVAAVLALSIVFGTPFFGDGWGFGFPFPLLVIGLIAVAVYATRGRRGQLDSPPPPWNGATAPPPGTTAYPATDPEGTIAMSVTDQPAATETMPGQQPPAWMPPQPPPYVPPPRPRRTGLVLFWPTLALIAIGLGTLGIFDTSSDVVPTAYAALAIAITGAMLLVGAFVGRPGGLIALGFVGVVTLVVTLVAGVTGGQGPSASDMRVYPPTASALAPEYRLTTGSLTVDLTGVEDVAELDGRVVALGVGAGEITVIVPRDLEVDVTVDVNYAGEINIGDLTRDGFNQSLNSTLEADDADAPTMDLNIEVNLGEITVRHGS